MRRSTADGDETTTESGSTKSPTHENPSRRKFMQAAGAAGVASISTAGCLGVIGGDGGGSSGSLNVIVWNDYTEIEDELADRIGTEIEMTAMTSSTKMFTKWNSGGAGQFDMALPNNNLVNKFYQSDLLQSIDTGAIDNWEAMYEKFRTLSDQQFKYDGSMFGVPIRFGWYGISYDKEDVPEDQRNTVETLWNDEYEGSIAVYDNHFKAIGMAALKLGFQDAFEGETVELSDDQIEQCKQALMEQKPLLFGYLSGNPSWVKAYKQENVVAGWSGRNEIVQLNQDGVERAGTTVAEQGGLAWYEAAIVSKKSDRKEDVQALINELLSPDLGAKLAKAGGAPTTNPKIADNLSDEEEETFMVDPSRLDSLIPFKPMANEEKWVTAWEEVKNA